MPKGHPISVPRTWPGHRDYEGTQTVDMNRIMAERIERDSAPPRDCDFCGAVYADDPCLKDDDACPFQEAFPHLSGFAARA